MGASSFQRKISSPSQSNENQETSSQQSSFSDNRESTGQITQLQGSVDNSSNTQEIAQLQEKVDNNTGMPDELKQGIEGLSGQDMSDVKVTYNSDKPAQLQAHAYAQGNNIHIAPGQEKYLPHEAWHVVQQKQGRVQPTKQLKSRININDDAGLEKEADVMGAKAANYNPNTQSKSVLDNNIKQPRYKSELSQLKSSIDGTVQMVSPSEAAGIDLDSPFGGTEKKIKGRDQPKTLEETQAGRKGKAGGVSASAANTASGATVDGATGARTPVDAAANADSGGIDVDTLVGDMAKTLQDTWTAALAYESSQKGNRLEAAAKGTTAFSKAVTSYTSVLANAAGAAKSITDQISGVGAALSAVDNIMKGIFEYQHWGTVERIEEALDDRAIITEDEKLVLSRYKTAIKIKLADSALSALLDSAELITLALGGVGLPAVKLVNCIYKSVKAGIGYYREYNSMKANQADKRLGIEGGALVREDSGAGHIDKILTQSKGKWGKNTVKNMVEIDLHRDELKKAIVELNDLKKDKKLAKSSDPKATDKIDGKIKNAQEELISLDKRISFGIEAYNIWMGVSGKSNIIPLTEPDVKTLSAFHKKNIESIMTQASAGTGNIGTKIKRYKAWIGKDDRTKKEEHLDTIIKKYGPLFDQDDEFIREIDIAEIKASGADTYFWDKTKSAIRHVAKRDKKEYLSSRVSFADINKEMEKIMNTLSPEKLAYIDKDFFTDKDNKPLKDSDKAQVIANWISVKGL